MILSRLALCTATAMTVATAVSAQQAEPQTIPFAGGEITITETQDMDKILAFDGRMLARNYFVFFDRIVEVAGQDVALISVGDGGNACAPGTVVIWQGEAEVDSDYIGDECGSPPPSVGPDRIHFVPYVLPGQTRDVRTWSPDERIGLAGRLSYAPVPDTGWQDLDTGSLDYVLDAFRNASIHQAARELLGEALPEVALGLSVSSGMERLGDGIVWSRGCVPHDCGGADAFMAIDVAQRRLFFAQQSDGNQPRAWPDVVTWPRDVRGAMMTALSR